MIVVLIIVGILASISLSSIYSWIEKSYGAEAVVTIRNITNNVEGCIALGKTAQDCLLNISGGSPGELIPFRTAHFEYVLYVDFIPNPGYFLWVRRMPSSVGKTMSLNCGIAGHFTVGIGIYVCRDPVTGRLTTSSNMYKNVLGN